MSEKLTFYDPSDIAPGWRTCCWCHLSGEPEETDWHDEHCPVAALEAKLEAMDRIRRVAQLIHDECWLNGKYEADTLARLHSELAYAAQQEKEDEGIGSL